MNQYTSRAFNKNDSMPRIQETHILIGHIFCDLVEQEYPLV